MCKWSVFPRGADYYRSGQFNGVKMLGTRSHGDTAKPHRVKKGPSGLTLKDALTAWKKHREHGDGFAGRGVSPENGIEYDIEVPVEFFKEMGGTRW